MMSKLAHAVAGAAILVASASMAEAQVSLSQTFSLSNAPGSQVAYFTFDVTTPGGFRLYTMGPNIDPNLWLFAGAQPTLGAALGFNDDSCPFSLCGPAGSYSNSLIITSLGVGTLPGAPSSGRSQRS